MVYGKSTYYVGKYLLKINSIGGMYGISMGEVGRRCGGGTGEI
jgi:hypothetical protein